MYFKLIDGNPIWATHEKDGEYFFNGDIIPEGAIILEQPSQEVIERTKKLKGKTYSKSEFEKLLFNIIKEEALEQRVNELELYILSKEGLI